MTAPPTTVESPHPAAAVAATGPAAAGRPLADMQLSMLAHETITSRPLYTMPLCFEITGPVDAAVLEAALHQVVRRHPVLHCSYADGTARPLDPDRPLPDLGVRILADPAPDAVRAVLDTWWGEPMELATGAPVRALLVSSAPDRHHLGLAVHHVAGDSWSLALLLEDLGTAYAALRSGREPAWPADAPDFFGYAVAERASTEDLAWWRERLAGLEPQPHPRRIPPPPAARGALQALPLHLDAADTRGIRELARTARVSPTAVLLAAVGLAVAGPGELTSTVGMPVVLRDTRALQATMGPLLNTLPVRTAWPTGADAPTVVRAHADALEVSLAHKDVPYSRLLRASGIRRTPGTAPLFLHVVNADNEAPRLRLPGVRCVHRAVTPAWAIFPAQWEFSWQAVGNIHGVLQTSADVFSPEQAADCAARFRTSLSRLLGTAPAEPKDLP
ncbi:condensation domain-containing protein [Streptomyces virginiae]|uniref:condensation domain-containing protein n=1 Tax=Streptomyces virginiae TaxID=1961 RepID=UPI0036E0D7B6